MAKCFYQVGFIIFKMKNYFEKFSLSPAFDINLDDLEQKYLTLQQQYHPDQLLHKTVGEQDTAAIESININEAYKILKNPISRAIYLLKLQGINIDDDNCPIKPDHSTLMQVLELREEISQIKNKDEINQIRNNLESEITRLMQEVKKNFSKNDFNQVAQFLIKIKYFDKTIADLKLKKQTL